jgi:hypothetical protein
MKTNPLSTLSMIRSRAALGILIITLGVKPFDEALGYSIGVPASTPKPAELRSISNSIFLRDDVFEQTHYSDILQLQIKDEDTGDKEAATRATSKASYDLGLGKNLPLLKQSREIEISPGKETKDIYQASMYWSEYESVRPFPSPIAPTEDMIVDRKRTTPKTRMIPIYPSRMSTEELIILATNDSRKETHKEKQPVMAAASQSTKIDLNTPWVEMLIHSEQLKYAFNSN